MFATPISRNSVVQTYPDAYSMYMSTSSDPIDLTPFPYLRTDIVRSPSLSTTSTNSYNSTPRVRRNLMDELNEAAQVDVVPPRTPNQPVPPRVSSVIRAPAKLCMEQENADDFFSIVERIHKHPIVAFQYDGEQNEE